MSESHRAGPGGRTGCYQEGRNAQKSREREPPVTDCLHVTRARRHAACMSSVISYTTAPTPSSTPFSMSLRLCQGFPVSGSHTGQSCGSLQWSRLQSPCCHHSVALSKVFERARPLPGCASRLVRGGVTSPQPLSAGDREVSLPNSSVPSRKFTEGARGCGKGHRLSPQPQGQRAPLGSGRVPPRKG